MHTLNASSVELKCEMGEDAVPVGDSLMDTQFKDILFFASSMKKTTIGPFADLVGCNFCRYSTMREALHGQWGVR